jgi:hypothetical protein
MDSGAGGGGAGSEGGSEVSSSSSRGAVRMSGKIGGAAVGSQVWMRSERSEVSLLQSKQKICPQRKVM